MTSAQQRVSVDQLRIGMYIQLDGWMDHPFLFNSFKIRTQEQLNVLRALALKDVAWVRDKSDVAPLPAPLETTVAVSVSRPEPSPEMQALWRAKQERRAQLARQREAYGRCEKRFHTGIGTVKSVLRNLFTQPHASFAQAQEVVSGMVDTLVLEKDVLIHLMNAKSGDEGAYYHVMNVTMLALMLAREAGFDADEMHALGVGCLLHDIGKQRVPSQILLKRSPWTQAERNFYRQHVLYGMEMAQKLPDFPAGAMEVIAMHHELMDGSGFPGGLKGRRIGKFARVAAIANSYDNLCNRINTADSMTPAEAVAHLFKREEGKYDPTLMPHFIRCLGVYPPGSLVRLNNDAIGLVTSVNPGVLLQPTLLIYDPDIPKEEALTLDLSEQPDLSVVGTLRPGALDKAVYDYLSPRSRVSYYADHGLH